MNDNPSREVSVFNAALQLPSAERIKYLQDACVGDAVLIRRVEVLLEAHERAGAFLGKPAAEVSSASIKGSSAEEGSGKSAARVETCGDHVGAYKLLQQIGEGGCGIVYMAEQEEPIRRRVALKVIKLGMDTNQVIARFEAERQALAMMDHPNIAKVLEAGATVTGRPYFAMELVRGARITDFCDENTLSTETRLDLFIKVCHAIQHAHQKGIIHRDIKPSNILVTVNDGEPLPKVIDFGIAKATQGRLTDDTLFTAFEQFIGTPAYMSPEQAVLTSVEVDTRSDIYSLGVLLYELLTGQTPFAQKELLASGLDEMRRTIREKEPVPPSTRLSAMVPGDLATVASRRQSQPPQLIHQVRGDLDWIVMRCLQKERARRYETANGLAMDVTRHLKHEPVFARPDSQAYRMGRFVRRHRASVAFAAVLLIALTSGLVGTITQAHRATRHARVAEGRRHFALRQLSRAEAINGLNTFLLSDAASSGKPFTIGQLLTRAEHVLAKDTGDSVENRVDLLVSIGEQYHELGEQGKARELFGKAYDLSRGLIEPAIRAQAAGALGMSIALAGECKRGEALLQEALRELGDHPDFVLYRIHILQWAGKVARECGHEEVGLERVQEAKRLLDASGQNSPAMNWMLTLSLAESYRMMARHPEAISAFAEAFRELSALGRDDTEQAGTVLNNWAVSLDTIGQPFEAERLYRRALEIDTAGATNASVSPMLLNNLARCLNELHRFPEAAQFAEQAYEKAKRVGGEQVLTMCVNVRSSIHRRLGELDRAAEMLAEFESRTTKLLPAGHVAFAIVRSQKSQLALARGDLATALQEANQAVAMVEGRPAARDRLALLCLRRAEVHLAGKRYEAARADAARAVALNQEALGPDVRSSWTGLAHLTVARAFRAEGKQAEARLAYASAIEHLRPSLGEDHPETRDALQGLSN